MTSQGQRFRRRALRRGYKVDEVDSFLDRVEATLGGNPTGAPVGSQEVHDVVFRVRFGGYDEWQVDLHLDRVERQLAELEERGGFGRPMERAALDRGGPPADRLALGGPDRMPTNDRFSDVGPGPGANRGAPMGPGGPLEHRQPMAAGGPPPAPMPMGGGRGPDRAPYDEPTYAGGAYDGFEPGRHGKLDMTAEIRMPPGGLGAGPGGPPPHPSGPMPGGPPPERMAPPPMRDDRMAPPPPPMGPGPGMGGPGMAGGGMGGPGMAGGGMGGGLGPGADGDAQRIDQLRRTFQPRRFGSGYDPAQVDRLFEGILNSVAGHAPVNEADLDGGQFALVPGGYFEAEVDAALKEVKDIIRRR